MMTYEHENVSLLYFTLVFLLYVSRWWFINLVHITISPHALFHLWLYIIVFYKNQRGVDLNYSTLYIFGQTIRFGPNIFLSLYINKAYVQIKIDEIFFYRHFINATLFSYIRRCAYVLRTHPIFIQVCRNSRWWFLCEMLWFVWEFAEGIDYTQTDSLKSFSVDST